MAKKKLFSELELAVGLDDMLQLFGLMLPNAPMVTSTEEAKVSEESTEEDYLANGQKLLTLAKESMPKHRNYIDLAKKLAALDLDKLSYNEVVSKISAVFRALLRPLGENVVDSEEVALLHKLLPHIKFDLCTYDEWYEIGLGAVYEEEGIKYLSHTTPRSIASRRYRAFEEGEKVLYLVCPQLLGKKVAIGFQKARENRADGSRVLRADRNHTIVDLSHILCYMYMAEIVLANFDKEDYRHSILYKGTYTKIGNAFMRNSGYWDRDTEIVSVPENPLKDKTVVCLVDASGDEGVVTLLKEKCKRVVAITRDGFNLIRETASAEILAEYLPANIMQSIKLKSCEKDCAGYSIFKSIKDAIKTTPMLDTPVLMEGMQLNRFLFLNSQENSAELTRRLVSRADNSIVPRCLCLGVNSTDDLMYTIFRGIHEVLHREVEEIEKEQREQSEHAKSFETKKNIPQKILKLMKDSVLNERFGYLEYDEKCDTTKIEIVNTQLLGFVETYFPTLDLKDISLRFRRLGNHKANGLYYPAYKCIAVELSHPSSFVHEFGHMLDYTQGKLSNCLNSEEFSKVYKKYVELLDAKLDLAELTAKYKQGGSKSKYKYYTEETEVFARSFEVYIAKTLKLDNTIVRTMDEFNENPNVYHPENEEYVQLVVDYFNQLECMSDLVRMCEKENNDAA